MILTDFDHIFKTLHKPLIYFCGQRLRERYLSEDIVSEIMIKLHARIHNFSTIGQVKNWLYRCAENACVNANKHTKVESKEEVKEGWNIESDIDIERALIKSELLYLILESIRKSVPGMRKIMELVYQGFSNDEISKKLRISIDTIRVQKKRFIDGFSKEDKIPSQKTLTIGGITKTIREWCTQTGVSYQTIMIRAKSGIPAEGIISKERLNNVMIHFNGQVKPLKIWCTQLGVDYKMAVARYHRDLPSHLILSPEKQHKKSSLLIHFNGQVKTLKQWCVELRISYDTARQRYLLDLPSHLILSRERLNR